MNDEHYKAAVHGVLTVCAVLESLSAKSSTRRALLFGMAVFHAHLCVTDYRDAQASRAAERKYRGFPEVEEHAAARLPRRLNLDPQKARGAHA